MSGNMKRLRRTNNPLDRNTRNDINYNWEVLDNTLSKIDTADFETDNRFNKIEQELENLDDVDQQLADKIQQNKDTIEALELDLIEEKGNIAEQKGNIAKKQGNKAKEQGDTAEAQGNKAQKQGNTAEAKGKKAEQQGNYAKEQGDYAHEKAEYAAKKTSEIIEANKDLSKTKLDTVNATAKANNSSKYAKEQGDYAKEQGDITKERTEYLETLLPNIEGWEFKGEWKSGTQYENHNIVTFNGSTYILLDDAVTGDPLQNKSWHMLAQRGVDGKGAVNTINKIAPDLNGNVDITALLKNTTLKESNLFSADEPPASYPPGVYAFLGGREAGYPGFSGMVVTYKGHELNNSGVYQTFTHVEFGELVTHRRFANFNDWSEWEKVENDASIGRNLEQHINDEDNPHKVTKSQIGLGNVKNEEQATKEEFDKHINDKTNPHNVTAEQVTMIKPKKATELMDTYPDGVTMFYYEEEEAEGYPHRIGTVLTAKGVDKTAFQFFARNGFNRASEHIWYRTGHITKGWSEWYQVMDEDDYSDLVSLMADIEKELERKINDETTKVLKGVNEKISELDSEDINVIDAMPSDAPLTDYPKGVSTFYINVTDAGYPHQYGTVTTYAGGNDVTGYQTFTLNNFNASRRKFFIRYYHNTPGWSEWYEIADNRDIDKLSEGGATLIERQPSDKLPKDFKSGATVFYTDITDSGYPHRIGTVVNFKDSDLTSFQLFARNGYNDSSKRLFYRTGHTQSGWSDWYEIADNREIEELKKEISDLRNAIIQLGGKL